MFISRLQETRKTLLLLVVSVVHLDKVLVLVPQLKQAQDLFLL